MIRILFLINNLDFGGAEKALIDLVNNMDASRFEITVQTLIDFGVYKSDINKNIRYRSVNTFKNINLRKMLTFLLYRFLPLSLVYKLFVADHYDYEVAYLEGLATKIISRSSNRSTQKIAWLHTDLQNNYHIDSFFKDTNDIRKCYDQFDRIVCVSNAARESFVQKVGPSSKLMIRYNLLDESKIRAMGDEIMIHSTAKDRFVIISVGRLESVKGYDRLLEAHKKLTDEGYQYDLWIVGDGQQKDELARLIKEYSISDSVKLWGSQKNPYPLIKSADLYVCSSRAEGLSNTVTEAIFLGTPVLTTDCAGMKELLGDSEFGLIVNNSTDGLYDGIKYFFDNRDQLDYYKKQSIIRAENFQKKNRMSEIESIFEN